MEELSPAAEGLDRAVVLLRSGEVVAIPTDTVYGLVALASRPTAVARIYEIKARPADKRLVLFVRDAAEAEGVAAVDPRARAWMGRWWPGPLTIVLRSLREVGETHALRAPAHPVVMGLLERLGEPLASTSANRSGEAPATTAAAAGLRGVAAVIEGGPASRQQPSTVVDLTGLEPVILREGAIPASELLGANTRSLPGYS